jgi:hypothetical protein
LVNRISSPDGLNAFLSWKIADAEGTVAGRECKMPSVTSRKQAIKRPDMTSFFEYTYCRGEHIKGMISVATYKKLQTIRCQVREIW